LYDITNRSSFDNIEKWLSTISWPYFSFYTYFADKFAKWHWSAVLIGTKCDLNDKREVSVEEGMVNTRVVWVKKVGIGSKT
jgi:GTPase SAR1 family protein